MARQIQKNEIITGFGKFRLGQQGTFQGCDHRGVLTIDGEICRFDPPDAEGNLWAYILVHAVYDPHTGFHSYEGRDVTRRLQLIGEKVDALHGRLPLLLNN